MRSAGERRAPREAKAYVALRARFNLGDYWPVFSARARAFEIRSAKLPAPGTRP